MEQFKQPRKGEKLGIALLLALYGAFGLDGYVHRDGGIPPKQGMYDNFVDDVEFIKKRFSPDK